MTLHKISLTVLFCLAFCFNGFSQYNLDKLYTSARSELEQNNFSAAFDKLDIIIKVKPGEPEAYLYRGICKYYLGDYWGAVQDMEEAIGLNPALYDAYYYRALAKNQQQDYEGALKDFDNVIAHQPKNPQIYIDRAFCRFFNQDFKGAIADCNKAIEKQSINSKLYLCKALAEVALEEFDNAIRDYNKALEITPLDENIYVRRGMTKAQMKKPIDAIADFNEALRIDSGCTFAYYNRALAKMELNDMKGALKDYNTVLKYDPRNALAYYNRGVLKINNKDEKGAAADFEQTLLLNPDNILAQFNLAKIKQSRNDYKGALEAYNKTIALYPYFVEAYYNRSLLKKSVNDFAGAEKDYNLGRSISEMNRYKSGTQQIRDSLTLVRLSKFDGDFNSVDFKHGHVDEGIDLLPIFSIVPKTKDNTSKLYSPLLQLINNHPERQFILSNKDTEATGTSLDTLYIHQLRKEAAVKSLTAILQVGILETHAQYYNDAAFDYDNAINQVPANALAYFARGISSCKEVALINHFEEAPAPTLLDKKPSTTRNEKNTYYEKALADFNKTIELDPTFAIAYYNRAFVKVKLRDINGAIKDYGKAIKIDPDFAEAHYNRGLMLLYLKNIQNACVDFSKAGEQGLKEAYLLIKRYCYR